MFGDSLRMGITTESSGLIKAPLYRRLGRLLLASPEVIRKARGERHEAQDQPDGAAVLVNVIERLLAVHDRQNSLAEVAQAAAEGDRQDKRLERNVGDAAEQHENFERR